MSMSEENGRTYRYRTAFLGGERHFCGMITRLEDRFAMISGLSERLFKFLAGILFLGVSSSAFSECSVDVVMVSGRVGNAPRSGIVRVQLVFPKQKLGESGDITVESATFRIQIPSLTQNHAPLLGSLMEKCDRKPKTVIVSLRNADQEYDRVSLDFVKDLKMVDASAYAVRSEILLHGPLSTTPVR